MCRAGTRSCRTTPVRSSNFPVHYDDPHTVHIAGDTITVEITFTGETVDGVPSTFEAVDVFTLEDGLIRRLTTWYDLDTILGFVRTPGTAGASAADARAACGSGQPVLRPAARGARSRARRGRGRSGAAAPDAARRGRGRGARRRRAEGDQAGRRGVCRSGTAHPGRRRRARPHLGRCARARRSRPRRHGAGARPVPRPLPTGSRPSGPGSRTHMTPRQRGPLS